VSAAPGRGLAAWTRFWFAREPSQRLALLRIFFGAAVLFQAMGVHGLYRLTHVRAGLPRHFAPDEYPLDAFRLPWPGLEWLPAPGYEAYRALEIALVPLAALFTAGLFTRVAGPLLALTFAYLFALSQLTYSCSCSGCWRWASRPRATTTAWTRISPAARALARSGWCCRSG
jgi:hypothetical protein